MSSASPTDLILRPPATPDTRILFLASHAPELPDYACRTYGGDGGYPAYYHRVWQTLTGVGYRVHTASHCQAVLGAAGRADLVFSLLNRLPINNPEVLVSSLCEMVGVPYIGARPNIRALAEDKWLSKHAARAAGLPVADGAVFRTHDDLLMPPAFAGPYFVKNRFGAASEGISEASIQDDWAGAARIAGLLIERGMEVLVERFAPGIDITVPVLGGSRPIFLGVVRPGSDRSGGIITEDLKRDDPLGYQVFDAGTALPALRADVAALWDLAGPMDYCRLDYRFDPASGRRVFLEFNICCHIGRSGAICLAARQWSLDQADVLGHVVEFSLRRQANTRSRPWVF
jgi:D-alanine-D-alanine ligase